MSRNQRATDKQQDPQSAARRGAQRDTQTAAPQAARLQRLPANTQAATSADVLALQGRVGNRAVQNLLATRQVQARLEVGAVDDPLERQADETAQQVMRAPSADDDKQPQPAQGQLDEE